MSDNTKFCKHCGAKIDIDARFCAVCGGDQTSISSGAPVEEQPAKQMETAQEQMPGTSTVDRRPVGRPMQAMPSKIWNPYIPEDEPVTRKDIMRGLKFDYKSTVKISHSSSFTALGLSLYILASLFNALTIVVALVVFDIQTDPDILILLFNGIFLGLISYFLLLTYFLTYMLKNTDIHVEFLNGIRLGGFLSIVMLLRAFLGIFYAAYVRLFVTGTDASDIFLLFEFNSYWITALALLVHLIIYLRNRIGMSGLLAFIMVISASVLASLILTPVFYMFAILMDYQIFNYAILAISVSTPVILLFGREKLESILNKK